MRSSKGSRRKFREDAILSMAILSPSCWLEARTTILVSPPSNRLDAKSSSRILQSLSKVPILLNQHKKMTSSTSSSHKSKKNTFRAKSATHRSASLKQKSTVSASTKKAKTFTSSTMATSTTESKKEPKSDVNAFQSRSKWVLLLLCRLSNEDCCVHWSQSYWAFPILIEGINYWGFFGEWLSISCWLDFRLILEFLRNSSHFIWIIKN